MSLEEESPVCRHYRVAADMLGKRWTPQILRGLLSGVTRYTDLKMLCADPSFREPGGYHVSWREHLTARHFQPRPDLLPDLDQMKPAKAPLLRKLVAAALTNSLGFKSEKRPGGVIKFVGRCRAHLDDGAVEAQSLACEGVVAIDDDFPIGDVGHGEDPDLLLAFTGGLFELHANADVGGKTISLYKLENDVIRPLGEERVHFALNCMVVSCPRLPRAAFSAAAL